MTRRRKTIALGAAVAVLAAGAAVLLWPRAPKSDVLEVPLGVEEAVILTSETGPLEPLPYAWGVGLNVRLAAERNLPGGHVYDVRYIVNHAGDFDLKDYLRFRDGSDPNGLPSFKVRGLERLSQSLEARIAETEETGVRLRAWYHETLCMLAVAWIGWLLLLVFWNRRRVRAALAGPAGPTLAERIRAVLDQLEAGPIDADRQAELELMIFRQWRQARAWGDQPMARSLAAFRADPEVAEAYAELETWLHRAGAATSPARVARAVRPRLEKGPPNPAPETLPT